MARSSESEDSSKENIRADVENDDSSNDSFDNALEQALGEAERSTAEQKAHASEPIDYNAQQTHSDQSDLPTSAHSGGAAAVQGSYIGKRGREPADEPCAHSVVWGSICADCGEPLFASSDARPQKGTVSFQYLMHGLEASQEHASALKDEQLAISRSKRKLLLVLDLDHTLLNSCQYADLIDDELLAIRQWSSSRPPPYDSTAICDSCSVHWLSNLQCFSKIRPLVSDFLHRASQLCDLYLFTMGSRYYAETMEMLLDSRRLGLFGSRVISAQDNESNGVKSLDIVVGQERGAIVIDDSSAVWNKHPDNLLRIERYHFFPASCRQCGVDESDALLSRGHDEGEDAMPQDHLPSSRGGSVSADGETQQMDESSMIPTPLQGFLRVIESVHSTYFNHVDANEDADVRQLLRAERAQTLSGVHIVFSRMFPASCSMPESTDIWQEALALGARCSLTVDSATTHIVAGDSRTEKAREGRKVGAYIVSARWLRLCGQRLQRMSETPFLLNNSNNNLSSR